MNSCKAKNEWEQDIHEVMNQEPLEDHDFDNKKTENKEDSQSVEKEGEKQQTAT